MDLVAVQLPQMIPRERKANQYHMDKMETMTTMMTITMAISIKMATKAKTIKTEMKVKTNMNQMKQPSLGHPNGRDLLYLLRYILPQPDSMFRQFLIFAWSVGTRSEQVEFDWWNWGQDEVVWRNCHTIAWSPSGAVISLTPVGALTKPSTLVSSTPISTQSGASSVLSPSISDKQDNVSPTRQKRRVC